MTVAKKLRSTRTQGTVGGLKNRLQFCHRQNNATTSSAYLKAEMIVLFEVWGDHINKEGKEVFNRVNTEEEQYTDFFIIRKGDKVADSKMFIIKDNVVYIIKKVIEYQKEWFLFKCNVSGPKENQASNR